LSFDLGFNEHGVMINISPTTAVAAPTRTPLSSPALLVAAVAAGLSVAGNYFAQPLLGLLRSELHMSTSIASLTVVMAQIGYALGLAFLVPLSDRYSRRGLAALLMMATGLLLVLAGAATNGTLLLIATALAALTSVGAQVLVPFIAELSTPDRRARNIGIVMSGVLAGGIIGRAFSGAVADAAGWRAVYWITAALLGIAALVILRILPYNEGDKTDATRLLPLLRSTAALFVELAVLRRNIIIAALSMVSYLIHLTTITLLLADRPYNCSPAMIGLIGLLGVAGPLSMPLAGRFVDRGHSRTVLLAGLLLSTAAWIVMLSAKNGQIIWLLAGIVMINVGHLAMLNAAQSTSYELRPEARSRISAVFMTLLFAGGAVGGTLAPLAWANAQWTGACTMGALCAGLGLLVAAFSRRRYRARHAQHRSRHAQHRPRHALHRPRHALSHPRHALHRPRHAQHRPRHALSRRG
jgi:predicted MFS family arabinose efflux permease